MISELNLCFPCFDLTDHATSFAGAGDRLFTAVPHQTAMAAIN
jgi:hypothetical protein